MTLKYHNTARPVNAKTGSTCGGPSHARYATGSDRCIAGCRRRRPWLGLVSRSRNSIFRTALSVITLLILGAADRAVAQSQDLVLSESSLVVEENADNSYTVKLATAPTADVTVTISGTSGTDLSVDNTSLTFTSTTWNAEQTVTVTAAGDTDATDDTATLTHTASGGDYASVTKNLPVAVEDVTTVTMNISGLLSSISEAGDVYASLELSASLNLALSDDVTLTVSAAPADANTTADHYTLSPDPPEITIASGATQTGDVVNFVPVDDHKTGHKNVTLTFTVNNDRVTVSPGTTYNVFIRNDDLAQITLELQPAPIFENGRAGRVRARLLRSRPQTEQVTLNIAATASSPTVASDFTLSGQALTFPPGSFMSEGLVEITANDDTDMDDEIVIVSATVEAGQGVIEPDPLNLQIVDDDESGPITLSLRLSPDRLVESGGSTISTVTAEASRPLSQAATITVSASPDSAVATTTTDDFTLSLNRELLIGVGETASRGAVTITAVDNALYEGTHKSVLVAGTVTGNTGVAAPPERVLTILENDSKALVQMIATPGEIDEDGGVSTISAVSFVPMPETVTFDVRVFGSTLTLSDNVQLTMPAGQTMSTGTVTVTAGDVAGTNNTSASISRTNLSSSSFTVRTTSVIILDDDATASMLWMLLSPNRLVEGQGQTSVVSAYLTQPLAENVSVTVAFDEDNTTAFADEYTLSTDRTLTISAGDTTSTGTVTLSTVDNDYYSHRFGSKVAYTYEVTGPDGLNAAKIQNDWNIVEDESPPEVTLVLTPDAIGEDGGMSTVTAELNSAVRSDVTVTVSTEASVDFTQTGSTLTIAQGSKTSTGTVTLTAIDNDVDALDRLVLVSGALTIADELSFGTIAFPYSRQLTITDDDDANLVLSSQTLPVNEGSSNTFRARLDTEPTANVTVNIGLPPGTDVSVNNPVLTFTPTTWNTEQTVTVLAAHDDDAVDDTAILTLEASGGGYGSISKDLDVTVTDDDEAAIVLSPAPLPVDENDDNSYTVKLDTEPTATVTVTIGGHSGTDLSLDKTSLTFTTTTWNTEQTVTVTAGDDDDGVDDDETLTHVASGGDYASVTKDLDVTVTDDDEAAIVIDPAPLPVDENDDNAYTVKLDTEPTATVTVTIGGHSGTDLSLDKTSLTFTTTTWNTEQTVTVTAGDDDDGVDDDETLTHTASGGDYGSVTKDLPVTVTDDDEAAIVIDPAPLPVDENDDNAYTVKLDTEPTATVTVTIGGTADTDLTTDPPILTFTTGNWSTEQTVTVTAGEDDDAVDDSATLTHTASGGDYGSVTKDLRVMVTDDDEPAIVLSPVPLSVDENDDNAYTVKLDTKPTATVTVTIGGHSGTDLSLDKTSLTFTTTTWNTEQTVTVSAGDDDDGVDDSETLTHTASGGDYVSVTKDLEVAVTDDDDPALVITPPSLGVLENGDRPYTVSLATEPTATVTVTIGGHSGTDLSLDKTSLTFTTTTWNTEQTVTVSAADDTDAVNDPETLTHTASGGDYGTVSKDLPVTVTDNDEAGLSLSSPALEVGENDDETYTVALATEPTATVTVTIGGHSGTDLSLDKSSLTFTATSWNTEQTVTVSAGDDDDAVNDGETLTHTASGGDYGSVSKDLPVTVADDDEAAIVLSPTPLTVNENDDNTYTVRLATEPTATVTVTIGGHSGTDLLLDKTSLTFTTGNWSTEQTVMVSAGDDDDAVNDGEDLTHTASGGDYGSVTKDLSVTVTDDDEAAIVLAPASLPLDENGDNTYTVKLATEPTATVTVTIGLPPGTDVSLDRTSLTFTTGNWNAEQTVRVSAGDDEDAVDDSETLTHAASGGDYVSETKDLPVTVTDDDEAAIVLAPASLPLDENDDATYTVVLDTRPISTVTVTIGGTAGTDLTTDLPNLTFTTGNWNVEQTVTVSAGDDDDAVNDNETLTHVASGGDYGSVTKDLPVTVTDDDEAGLVLAPETLGVRENGSAPYRVRLATRPTADVSVAISGYMGTDLTLDETGLTFTTATWNVEQTVTVTAGDDVDAVSEDATISHTASGGDYGSVTADLSVVVTDDDAPALVLSPPSLTLMEGENVTYTVSLATRPTAGVTVTIGGTADTDLLLDKTLLTFSTTDWNIDQTVSVSAEADDDSGSDTATLTHTAFGGDYGSVTRDLRVLVTDDDEADLVISPRSLTVTEGSSASYRVRLSTLPGGAVTVTIVVTSDADVSLSTTTLRFTPENWNVDQSVRVSAAHDADSSDDSARLSHSAAGAAYGSVRKDLPVRVADDDEVGLVMSPASLSFGEGTSTAYTVKLFSQPGANVIVTISGGSEADLRLGRNTLAFNNSNWNTAQTVTVTAGHDDDAVNDTGVLAHMASGGNYGSVRENLPVTVIDDDSGGGGRGVAGDIVLAPASLRVDEGTHEDYTIALNAPPGSDVTVTIGGTTGTDISLDKESLTFGTASWNTPQTVRVSAAHDDDADDDSATLSHAASGGGYDTVGRNLAVTVTDDDTRDEQAGAEVTVSFARTNYTAEEGGNPAQVTVRVVLNSDPEREVTVPLTVDLNGGATPDDFEGVPEAITFGVGQMAKSFNVIAVDDDVDDDGESLTIGFGSLPDRIVAGRPSSTEIHIVDNDDPMTVVSFARDSYTAREGSAPARVTVRVMLSGDPERRVTVPISVNLLGGATLEDFEGVPASVTFGRGEMEKFFDVIAVDDDLDDDDESIAVGFGTLPDRVIPGNPAEAVIHIEDDDDPVVNVSFDRSSYDAAEGGNPALVAVLLGADPEREVTIPVVVTHGGGATAADYDGVPPNVVFNSGETRKQFAIAAVDDDVDDDGESVTLGFGTLPERVERGRPMNAAVTIVDNDERGVTVSTRALAVPEGQAASYTVVIRSEPTSQVNVDVTVTANPDVSVDPLQMTFSTENWDVPQEVVVLAAHDDDAIVDRATLNHATSGGDYGAVAVPSLAVTVIEDDVPVVAIGNERVTEHAGDMVFTVSLDVQSSEEVIVNYATSNGTAAAGADYVRTRGALRFDPLETRLTINVPIVDDSVEEDTENFRVILSRSVNATLNGGEAAATGTIDDNDAAIRALEIFLSSVGRMVASDAVEVISRRFDSNSDGRPSLTLGGQTLIIDGDRESGHRLYSTIPAREIAWIEAPGQRIPTDAQTAQSRSHLRQTSVWDVLSRSDIYVPYRRRGGESGWTLWGRGAISGFHGAPGTARRMDADAISSYVGIDYNIRSRALLGLAATRSAGDLNYTHSASGRTLVPIDFSITTLLPYLLLKPHPRFGLWGMFGTGRGRVELVDADGGLDTDLALRMGAGGGRQHLTTLDRVQFALKGDAFYVETTSDGNARLPEVREQAKRVRLLIEGRHTHRSGRKSRFSQNVEIGGRWDSGRVENGRGVDVGGGIEYTHVDHGVSLSARGRYLVLHQQPDYEEWGASLFLRISPGYGERGMLVDVTPAWGAPADSDGTLWLDAPFLAFNPAETPGVRPDRMKVDIGYRLLTADGKGTVTPYGGWTAGPRGRDRYRIGGRLRLGRAAGLDVWGTRQAQGQDAAIYSIRITGRIVW